MLSFLNLNNVSLNLSDFKVIFKIDKTRVNKLKCVIEENNKLLYKKFFIKFLSIF